MMTFSEKIAHVAETDPKYARSVKRLRLASWVFAIALLLALVVAFDAYFVNGDQGTTINTITNSACARAYGTFGQKTPSDMVAVRECEALRVAIAKAEGAEGPCILYQRATGHQGSLCPRFYVKPQQ
jgi:hypothetical protein